MQNTLGNSGTNDQAQTERAETPEPGCDVQDKGIRAVDDKGTGVPENDGTEGGEMQEEEGRLDVASENLPELYEGTVEVSNAAVVSEDEQAGRLRSRLEELSEQLGKEQRDKQTLVDQLLRRQAEFENYRKRTEREKLDLYARARADVCVELLPVLDNFERALAHGGAAEGEVADGLVGGLELVHKQFRDLLAKCGLETIPTVGEKFDPDLHDAVMTEEASEVEENVIVEEFQRGYRLGNKVLRPSKVKVAVRK